MKELVIATNNKHKLAEISSILEGLAVKIIPLSDFKGIPEVVEDGETLEENALKKARTIAKKTKRWALADDSGLEVPYLNNEPGVYSARWAGPHCSYIDNNLKLLRSLEGVPKARRKARFRTVIALSDPAGRAVTVEGRIEGLITEKQRGNNGFGYDPVFFVSSLNKTLAQLTAAQKNKISHRGMALKKAKKLIISKLTASR